MNRYYIEKAKREHTGRDSGLKKPDNYVKPVENEATKESKRS